MALPSAAALEVLVAELIALILLILAGARLIIHEWQALLRSMNDGNHERFAALPQRASRSPDYRRKANPETEPRPVRRPRVTDSSEGSAGVANRRKNLPPGGKKVA